MMSGIGWKCKIPWCREASEDHRLCGVPIDTDRWHRVFSSDGKMLKPSDGGLYVICPSDFYVGGSTVRVPAQRKKNNDDDSLTA